MIERDLGEGGHWYLVAVHYPTALMARRAWERAESKLDMRAGDEGIGITRLGPNPNPGAGKLPTGTPAGVHAVVAITLDRRTAQKAERILRDGTHWTPVPRFMDALIARRARIVAMHAETGSGRVIIRRPDARGGELDPSGEIHEQGPAGQG